MAKYSASVFYLFQCNFLNYNNPDVSWAHKAFKKMFPYDCGNTIFCGFFYIIFNIFHMGRLLYMFII